MPPKEKFQFEREMTKAELKVMRNWEDIGNRRGWKGLPDDTLGRIRLYIHEMFALEHWRKRDGGKGVSVVKITVRTDAHSSTLENTLISIFLAWKQD
jgi:hypothetical protein